MSGVDDEDFRLPLQAVKAAADDAFASGNTFVACELDAAHNAIAELIAASGTLKVLGDGRGYFESGQDCERFRAALAAFKSKEGA